MKKLSPYIFLFLIWCNVGFAEKYVCSYLYYKEPKSLVFERSGQFFKKSNGALDEIVFEDKYAIVLSNTYTLNGEEAASTFSTIIDKKRLTFVFVGLEYQANSHIAEGKCSLY
tara:strand:- start:397 stop:735 length:339 start_codon:yes stop_codon:yes gene_type:complete